VNQNDKILHVGNNLPIVKGSSSYVCFCLQFPLSLGDALCNFQFFKQ